MAVRIAIANHKGGVAKSTTALMLAEGLALHCGARVLAIDLDPQASLSTMLLSRAGADAAAARGRSLSHLLELLAGQKQFYVVNLLTTKASDLIELRDAGDTRRVDLLASDRQLLMSLTHLEAELRSRFDQRLDVALAKALDPDLARLDKSYDVIVFDCAAGTGPLSLAAVRLSNLVISPTVLDAVSINALQDFIRIIMAQDVRLSERVNHYVLPTLFDGRDSTQAQHLDHIRAGRIRLRTLPRVVRETVNIRKASDRLKPDAFRGAREKYGAAISDVYGLADDVAAIIWKSEPRA